MGYPGLATGSQLVFLRESDGRLVFTDRHYPTLPAAAGEGASTADTGNPLGRVVAELGNVLASTVTSTPMKWSVLAIAYAVPKTASFSSSLQAGLRATTDIVLRERIDAELIRRADITSLRLAANWLLTDTLSESSRNETLNAIANSLTNPDAVPVLNDLLRSGGPSVRRAAMEALWHIGVPSSVELLIAGLKDNDHQVRFYAVRALADIYNDPDWGPAEGLFDRDEERYLTYWERWAAKNPSRNH